MSCRFKQKVLRLYNTPQPQMPDLAGGKEDFLLLSERLKLPSDEGVVVGVDEGSNERAPPVNTTTNLEQPQDNEEELQLGETVLFEV